MLAIWQHVMPNDDRNRLRVDGNLPFRRRGQVNNMREVERFEALDFFTDSRIQRVRRLVGHTEASSEGHDVDLRVRL